MSPVDAASPAARTGAHAHKVGLAYWGVTILLAVGVLIAYADRSSISAAIANHAFTRYFAMSAVNRGWLGSAFFWSYALAQIPLGWAVDRYGAKIPYAVCFALWCIATALSGAATAFAALVVMRFVVGAAEAVVMPASYRWFRYNVPERHTGSAIGIFAMGNKLGTALGAPLAAWLIVAYDWRIMFLITGSLGLIWLIPWMLMVRNDLPKGAEIAIARRRVSSVSFRSLLSSPVVWGGIIVNFCYSYFVFYCMTWMPSYLVEQQGLSAGTIAASTPSSASSASRSSPSAQAGPRTGSSNGAAIPVRTAQDVRRRRIRRCDDGAVRREGEQPEHGAVLEHLLAFVARSRRAPTTSP